MRTDMDFMVAEYTFKQAIYGVVKSCHQNKFRMEELREIFRSVWGFCYAAEMVLMEEMLKMWDIDILLRLKDGSVQIMQRRFKRDVDRYDVLMCNRKEAGNGPFEADV